MFKEFRNFALKGNVLDMAVGIIIGAAFGTIVKSLVDDVIMPPIGLLVGNVDFSQLFVVIKDGVKIHGPYATVKDAASAGAVTLNYGMFINSVVSFLIVAFSVFLIVKAFQKIKKLDEVIVAEPTTKECPYCYFQVPKKATKCGHCTSVLTN